MTENGRTAAGSRTFQNWRHVGERMSASGFRSGASHAPDDHPNSKDVTPNTRSIAIAGASFVYIRAVSNTLDMP